MKIVIIHGQSHKGSSYHMGRMLVNRIEEGKNITEYFLPKDLNRFCMGCYTCLKDEKKCPHYEEVGPIQKKMEEADLLVFTTPVYCQRTSAPMKSLLDHLFINWMPHRPKESMFFKKAVVLSSAAGSGMTSAIKDIKTSLNYWGISYVKGYGVRSAAMRWEDVKTDKKEKIEKDLTKLAEELKKNKPAKVSIKTKIIFMIMASMQKANMGSCPEDKEYWEKQGWLGDKRPWKK